MEQQENKPNSNDWIKKLEKELTELGVKQGNFLHKGSTYLYIPKSKKQQSLDSQYSSDESKD